MAEDGPEVEYDVNPCPDPNPSPYWNWICQCRRIEAWGNLHFLLEARALGLGTEGAYASVGALIDEWVKMTPKWRTTVGFAPEEAQMFVADYTTGYPSL